MPRQILARTHTQHREKCVRFSSSFDLTGFMKFWPASWSLKTHDISLSVKRLLHAIVFCPAFIFLQKKKYCAKTWLTFCNRFNDNVIHVVRRRKFYKTLHTAAAIMRTPKNNIVIRNRIILLLIRIWSFYKYCITGLLFIISLFAIIR